MTSEKLSTKKLESEPGKLQCKEEVHHLNMEEVTGSHQKQVLLKEMMKKHHHHGTQQNQEKFLMLMSNQQLLL
jgi:hypothetical protein